MERLVLTASCHEGPFGDAPVYVKQYEAVWLTMLMPASAVGCQFVTLLPRL